MSTTVNYTKGGIKVQCDVSLYPAPRPQAAYPIPHFPNADSSLLSLTLFAVANQAASGIQVAPSGTLPGGPSAVWTLFHQAYQGTPSPLPTPDALALTVVNGAFVALQFPNAMNGATHNFWLMSVDGTKTTVFPLSEITTPADPTQGNISNAAISAAAANAELANIASDNMLSMGEKGAVIQDYTVLTTEQAGIDAQAVAFTCSAVDAAKATYDAAVTALTAYLGTLTGWNVVPGSDVVIVGTTFRAKFTDVTTARSALLNAVSAQAKALADAANAGVSTINDPDTLGKDEKPQVLQDYATLTGENADLVAKATSFGVSHSAYDTAYTALVTTYLPTLTSPVLWSLLTGNTALGAGNRVALWNPKWLALRSAANDLKASIASGAFVQANAAAATAAAANSTAVTAAANAPLIVTGLPTLPNATYPANKLVYDNTTKRLYRSMGSAWEASTTDAGDLTGTISAARVAVGSLDSKITTITNTQLGTGIDITKLTGTLDAARVAVGALDSKISSIGNSQISGLDGSKITADTITATQIAANAVTSSELAANSVVAGKIQAGTIVAADIAAAAITGDRLAANTITADEIAADTITADQIAANAITSNELAANAVVAGKIQAGTIVAADIAAAAITGDRLAANTITASQIAADTITAGQIAVGAIGADEIAAGSVFAKHLVVANFDNLIPNPGSNIHSAPAGSLEASGLATGAACGYSDNPGVTTGYYRQLFYSSAGASLDLASFPCNPGDQIYAECLAGWTSTGADDVRLCVVFDSASSGWIAGNSSNLPTTYYPGSGTKLSTTTSPAPAGTVKCRIFLYVFSAPSAGNGVIANRFYARRMNDANVIVDGAITANKVAAAAITAVKLDAAAIQTSNYTEVSGNPTAGARMDISSVAFKVASGNFQIGTYIFTDYWFRLLQAIDGNYSGGVVVVRGNIDTSTRGGAADMGRLGLYGWGSAWDGSCSRADYEYEILPTNTFSPASDNIEALSHLLIKVCTASSSSSPLMTRKVQVGWGRTYNSYASNKYGNTHCGSFTLFKRGSNYCGGTNNQSTLWLRCSLFNAYGQSAERDYSPTTGADGSALGNSSITGLGSTGGPNGGSGVGGLCPAPWVKIQLASGLQIDAADLYDGAQVQGVDEESLEPRQGIVRNPRIRWTERMPILLADGRVTEFSPPHRLLVIGKGWTEVRDLQPGDSIMAQQPSIVQALGKPALAQVVSFTVEGCSTYFADGLLAHNMKSA